MISILPFGAGYDSMPVSLREATWDFEENTRIAEQEFDRARFHSFLRALFLSHERRARGPIDRHGVFSLPFDNIAGIVRADGSLARGLPVIPRSLRSAWCHNFARIGQEESGQSLSFRLDSGEWYLEGGSLALLKLEILRSRGERAFCPVQSREGDENASFPHWRRALQWSCYHTTRSMDGEGSGYHDVEICENTRYEGDDDSPARSEII